MLRFFEILTGIGAALAGIMLVMAFASDMSAPQQGAAAAMALGFVVIPYCVLGMLQRRALLDRSRPAKDVPAELRHMEPLEF